MRFAGDLDLASRTEATRTLAEASSRSNGTLVVDLTGVGFLDAAGVELLASTRVILRSRGRDLELRVARGPVTRILAILADRARLADVIRDGSLPDAPGGTKTGDGGPQRFPEGAGSTGAPTTPNGSTTRAPANITPVVIDELVEEARRRLLRSRRSAIDSDDLSAAVNLELAHRLFGVAADLAADPSRDLFAVMRGIEEIERPAARTEQQSHAAEAAHLISETLARIRQRTTRIPDSRGRDSSGPGSIPEQEVYE